MNKEQFEAFIKMVDLTMYGGFNQIAETIERGFKNITNTQCNCCGKTDDEINKDKRNIVEKLGGYKELQNKMKLSSTTVYKWEKNKKIPLKYWPRIKDMLEAKKIKYTYDDFINL